MNARVLGRVCAVILNISVVLNPACKIADKEVEGSRSSVTRRDINEVKEAHTKELMSLPGVVGVYVGQLEDHTPCIGVMVEKKTTDLEKLIPRRLEGYPVRVDETGVIKPMK